MRVRRAGGEPVIFMMTKNENEGLRLSELVAVLKTAPELPVVVVWPDGEPIEAHFHVTEVGRVQRDFIDCGGTLRSVVTCLLQTWVADDTDHRLTGGKLVKAIAAAAPVLRGEDPPVELEYEACNVVQLKVVAAERGEEAVVVRLGKKNTDCLAKDVCLPGAGGAKAAGGGCC